MCLSVNMYACLLSNLPTYIASTLLHIYPSNHLTIFSSVRVSNQVSIRLLLLTVGRPVIVILAFRGEENRVYGFRLAALLPIQCEVPASTRSGFRSLVYQPHVTVPLNTQHCVVVFLFDDTSLEQEQADTSQPVTRRTYKTERDWSSYHKYVCMVADTIDFAKIFLNKHNINKAY